jgi:atypical dual specificity phosphatase
MSNVPLFVKNIYVPVRLFFENYIINLADNNDINEVADNLYVGNISTATNKELLQEKGITHIINILSHRFEPYPSDFEYMHIHAYDVINWTLIYNFQATNLFIRDALKDGGKVYIHCMCGVSRSVSVLLAYLMTQSTKSLDVLLKEVQSARPVANPNPGFITQLIEFRKLIIKNHYKNIHDIEPLLDNKENDDDQQE